MILLEVARRAIVKRPIVVGFASVVLGPNEAPWSRLLRNMIAEVRFCGENSGHTT